MSEYLGQKNTGMFRTWMANKCSLLRAWTRLKKEKRTFIGEHTSETQYWYGSQYVKSKQNGSAMAEGGNTRPGTYFLSLSSLTPMTGKFLILHSKNHLSRATLSLQMRKLIGNRTSETAYTMVSCGSPNLWMINIMTFILFIVSLLAITNQFQMWLWNSPQCSNKLWTIDWRWHVSCSLLAICVLSIHVFVSPKYSHIEPGWMENSPERWRI